MNLTRIVQIPTTVIETGSLKQGELYSIVNDSDDSYIVAGLETFDEFQLKFDNGLVITAEDLADSSYKLSPVETYIDRWVAVYCSHSDMNSMSTSFFVAYDKDDALGVAEELRRTNPKLIDSYLIILLSLSQFMDKFGYMPHGAVHTVPVQNLKGRNINVSE